MTTLTYTAKVFGREFFSELVDSVPQALLDAHLVPLFDYMAAQFLAQLWPKVKAGDYKAAGITDIGVMKEDERFVIIIDEKVCYCDAQIHVHCFGDQQRDMIHALRFSGSSGATSKLYEVFRKFVAAQNINEAKQIVAQRFYSNPPDQNFDPVEVAFYSGSRPELTPVAAG